ncbi:MAG: Dam family site-specific DNA-(adenine-N6)-methyltransferase [Microcoleaceae cyanobacterium]
MFSHQETEYKPTPILKWAGGKSRLLPQIRKRYPSEKDREKINTYIEPFIGGGAVFFDIISFFNLQNIYLFDTNIELIILYKTIQKDVNQLIQELLDISDDYLRLDENERINFYYQKREEYNQFNKTENIHNSNDNFVRRSALTLFLNRTCFNGLFRVNKKGKFNVPHGRYKNPKILNIENLQAAAAALQIATLQQVDFSEVLKYADSHTFIYYDPPYRPISKTSNFNAYGSVEFDDNEQHRLQQVFTTVSQQGGFQMLSNSDPTNYVNDDFFDELYKDFKIERILASRMINSKGNSRGEIRELLITNY